MKKIAPDNHFSVSDYKVLDKILSELQTSIIKGIEGTVILWGNLVLSFMLTNYLNYVYMKSVTSCVYVHTLDCKLLSNQLAVLNL